MLIAAFPIDGKRNNGRLLPRDSFKDQIDSALKPHLKEPCSCGETFEGCCCFRPGIKRRIAVRNRLDDLGIAYEEISTHSYRKGSGSYCASGSTQGPPIVAICLRAGWKLGGVLNTYMVLENAGDCFVGRVAAGLPILRKVFAVLPPRFTSSNTKVDVALAAMFGQPYLYGQDFAVVLRHALASLCFHKEWLETLPQTHYWHSTYLAQNPDIWSELQRLVGPLKYGGDDLQSRYASATFRHIPPQC
jgi:hypothetical protein